MQAPNDNYQHHCSNRIIHNRWMRTFGDRLKKLRQDLKLSQEHVAKAIGVSQKAISSLESVPDRAPSSENLQALASFFQVEAEWLLTGKGPQTAVGGLSDQEKELLLLFRALSTTGKHYVLGRTQDVYQDEFSMRRPEADSSDDDQPAPKH